MRSNHLSGNDRQSDQRHLVRPQYVETAQAPIEKQNPPNYRQPHEIRQRLAFVGRNESQPLPPRRLLKLVKEQD